ncbi:hypothetical protein [Limnobaculum parvum]|uniref:Uncharacterized protein n=1 Tax=Limnobaculum parvum TaxID=2172103 RepID=A0A2Y9TUW2_9GAMM|nr:hypothetical protein [Limnobaculum parvum]AWH87507.1 hypothetical protein HYN51_02365 [Limnobaculum parvum]
MRGLIVIEISTTGVGSGVAILPVLIWLSLTAVTTASLMSMRMKIPSTRVHFCLGNRLLTLH